MRQAIAGHVRNAGIEQAGRGKLPTIRKVVVDHNFTRRVVDMRRSHACLVRLLNDQQRVAHAQWINNVFLHVGFEALPGRFGDYVGQNGETHATIGKLFAGGKEEFYGIQATDISFEQTVIIFDRRIPIGDFW